MWWCAAARAVLTIVLPRTEHSLLRADAINPVSLPSEYQTRHLVNCSSVDSYSFSSALTLPSDVALCQQLQHVMCQSIVLGFESKLELDADTATVTALELTDYPDTKNMDDTNHDGQCGQYGWTVWPAWTVWPVWTLDLWAGDSMDSMDSIASMDRLTLGQWAGRGTVWTVWTVWTGAWTVIIQECDHSLARGTGSSGEETR